MNRRAFASIVGPLLPPVIGAAYLVPVAVWAVQSPTLDEREGGAQARQIDAVVHGHFGGEIVRMGVAILAAALIIGALLGWTAAFLVALRDRLGAPRTGPPRSLGRRALLLLAIVVGLHAILELWAMAQDPQLYAGAWYESGGLRRTVQVLATDVLGPRGAERLALLACAVFLAGPFSRWPGWPERASRAAEALSARLAGLVGGSWESRRIVALCASVGCAVTLAALAVTHTPSAIARPKSDVRPNVLVLAADSLRADRLDPRVAPHLTALAAKGTTFDHAYVSLPRTFPSWVTILTGRHPHHHGIRSMFPRWEERTRDFDALPERLARAGWATGVVSDYAGDIFSRIDLGFGTVDVPEFDFRQLVRQRALERETPLLPILNSRVGRSVFPVLHEMNDAADPALLSRDAVRMMRSLEGRGPFFLVVFYSTAHFPYAAPAPYYTRFTDPDYRGRFKYFKRVGLGHEMPANLRDQAQVRGLYDGAVSAIDDAAQTVIDALATDGLADRTVVVVTADHGETLFEHGHGQGHGDHLFGDEGTHVPLVIVDPRKGAAVAHEDAVVRDVDLAATLYDLTSVPPPEDLDGRSLAGALDGKGLGSSLAYAETGLWFTEDIPGLPRDLRLPYPGVGRMTEVDTEHGDEVVLRREVKPLFIVAKHRMVRDDRWKLVYAPARGGVRWLLFDTIADPGEEHDVAPAHPEVVSRLQADLWSWMRRDPEMTEHNGYLVPRDPGARAVAATTAGAVRLDEEGPSAAAGTGRAPPGGRPAGVGNAGGGI